MGATAALALAGAYQAHTQYQAGQDNKRVQQFNAKVSDMQAKDAIERGNQDALKQQVMARRVIGEQRVAAASGGQALGGDTSAQALTDESHALGALDALRIRNNAAREAWGYRVDARGARMRGRIDAQQGSREATGTLLTTGASTYRMGYESSRARSGGY